MYRPSDTAESGVWSERIGADRTEIFLNNAKPQELVRWFHRKYGGTISDVPTIPAFETLDFRWELIREEVGELFEEMHPWPGTERDLTRIAHEAGDVLAVVLGLFVEIGVDAEGVLRELTRSNMTKDYAGDGQKPTKGDGFRPADLSALVPSGGGTDG